MTLYYVYVAMLVHHNGVEAMRPFYLNRCDICKNLIGVNELGFLHPVDFVTLAIPDIYTAAFSTGTYSNVLPVVVFGGK